VAIKFLYKNGPSETFYDYKIKHYRTFDFFLQLHPEGKAAKHVRPGQTVQLRNASITEIFSVRVLRTLGKPASWWLSQPGYECLLTFVSGRPDNGVLTVTGERQFAKKVSFSRSPSFFIIY
jgi:hypothetical protein